MKKIELNANRELLITSIWIFPLIPMTMFIILGFYFISIIFVLWLILFGFIFYLYHAELIIYDDKLVIKRIKKKYIIKFEDILLVNETKNYNNKWGRTRYKIILKESKNNIPERFLTIENHKFSKIYKSLNLNTNVIYRL